MGRYHALKSDLQILDLSPSVAYRVNSQWSVGAAFVARRTHAELTNAVDFGTILLAKTYATSPASVPGLMAAGVLPGQRDGLASLEGTKWSYGYKLGATFQPTKALRFGLGYQSAIKVKLEGDATFQIPTSLTPFAGSLQKLQVKRGSLEVRIARVGCGGM